MAGKNHQWMGISAFTIKWSNGCSSVGKQISSCFCTSLPFTSNMLSSLMQIVVTIWSFTEQSNWLALSYCIWIDVLFLMDVALVSCCGAMLYWYIVRFRQWLLSRPMMNSTCLCFTLMFPSCRKKFQTSIFCFYFLEEKWEEMKMYLPFLIYTVLSFGFRLSRSFSISRISAGRENSFHALLLSIICFRTRMADVVYNLCPLVVLISYSQENSWSHLFFYDEMYYWMKRASMLLAFTNSFTLFSFQSRFRQVLECQNVMKLQYSLINFSLVNSSQFSRLGNQEDYSNICLICQLGFGMYRWKISQRNVQYTKKSKSRHIATSCSEQLNYGLLCFISLNLLSQSFSNPSLFTNLFFLSSTTTPTISFLCIQIGVYLPIWNTMSILPTFHLNGSSADMASFFDNRQFLMLFSNFELSDSFDMLISWNSKGEFRIPPQFRVATLMSAVP